MGTNNNSWKINPVTGDYVMSGGAPVIDTGLTTPAYFRLRIHRTQWMYAPDTQYGSDFYSVQQRHNPNDYQGLLTIANNALQPLVDQGRAITADSELTGQTRSQVNLKTTIVDVAGNPETINLNPIGI